MELIQIIKYVLFGLVGLFFFVLIITFIASQFKKEPPPEPAKPKQTYKYERPKKIPQRKRSPRQNSEKRQDKYASRSKIVSSKERSGQITKNDTLKTSTRITSRYEVIIDLKKAKSPKQNFQQEGFN